MEKLNIAQLKGKIVSEPEMTETPNGKKLLKFRLMYYTPQTTDKDGSHANFIEVLLWEKLAEKYVRYLAKDLEILIAGNFYQSRWEDQNGKKASQFRFSCETLAITDIHFSTDEARLSAA